jgi:hypothetical protein
MDFAFEFVAKHGGIELEKDYPYTGEALADQPLGRYTSWPIALLAYRRLGM